MKHTQIVLMVLLITLPLNAQDITNKLGGNTATETYDVTDSADNVLLRVQGDGKVGVGTDTPSEVLDVDGNIAVSGTVDGIDIATDITANTAKVTDDDNGVAEVYGAGWDSDIEAPTKDDVYDKIETLPGGHDAVTIGTANGLSLSTQQISLSTATTSTAGAMSATDKTKLDGLSSGGNTLDQAYDQGGAGAGRTITADAGAFNVGGVDGALFTGTLYSGTIPATGGGTRMMWYPAKAAFRAGYVNSSQWDDGNIGGHSTAMGRSTTASGNYSTAMGYNTEASGIASTAMGYETTASGDASTAMGLSTTASGSRSTAMGSGTTASGDYSTALDYDTEASGMYSTAMGRETIASGDTSFASGYLTKASGNTSTAMGYETTASGGASTAMGAGTKAIGTTSTAMGAGTTASGEKSTAMGLSTTASGDYSTAIGYWTIASTDMSTVLGKYNEEVADALFIVGDGTSGGSGRRNAFTVDDDGDAWIRDNLYIGTDDGTNNDYIYFDSGTDEYLRWNNSETLFEFSDDLAVGTTTTNDNDYIYFDNNKDEYLRWRGDGGYDYFQFSDDLKITNDLIANDLWTLFDGGGTEYKLTGSLGTVFYDATGSFPSDSRLKENITIIATPLEKIKSLRGVTFNWNPVAKDYFIDKHKENVRPDRSLPVAEQERVMQEIIDERLKELSQTETSFIAQEVEEVFPEWVIENEDGYKEINMKGLNSLLVEAVKELKAEKDKEVQELRDYNVELREEIAGLKSIITEILMIKD